MKVLLDTHAALFAWADPDQLSERGRELIENPEVEVFFSQVSSLEIALKHRIGKLELPELPSTYIGSRIHRSGFQYLALDDSDIFGLSDLPKIHRDPFDLLLVATAIRLKLPLISRDRHIGAYPVELVW